MQEYRFGDTASLAATRSCGPVVCSLLALLGGCSFFAVKAPPSPVELAAGASLSCTSSRLTPALDIAGSTVATLQSAAATLFGGALDGGKDAEIFTGIAIGWAAVAVLYGVSAHRGLKRVRACRRLKAGVREHGSEAPPWMPTGPPGTVR